MTIHKEGYPSISIGFVIYAILNFISNSFIDNVTIQLTIFILTTGLFLFLVSFFRIPKRTHTIESDSVVSPCDGKVVVIEETLDPEYFKDKRLQVSIFMSPANVHVNRNPLSGEVLYSVHHKGKFLVAWDPKSSTDNERHSVVIRHTKADILVKQIAGALAKRIVNYLKPGDQVSQGEELGFIKFGSRVDLLLPPGTKVNVALGQVVKGGVTVIAQL